MSVIPNNIIQFWHDKTILPKKLLKSHQKTMQSHPAFISLFSDDNSAKRLIENEFPKILDLYKLNRIPASRSDIARLVLLYCYGGFWIDISFSFHRSFLPLIDPHQELVFVKRDDMYKENPEEAHVMNGFIGAPANHEFIRLCIEKIYQYLSTGELNDDVWSATGPGILNELLPSFTENTPIQFIKTTELQDYGTYTTCKGYSSKWSHLQKNGIINPSFYQNKSGSDL